MLGRPSSADLGKVLVGVQVQPEEREAFDKFLVELGYSFVDETQNPLYQTFLR